MSFTPIQLILHNAFLTFCTLVSVQASYSCSNLADMLGFVRAVWLMWLRDFLVLLDAIGYENGCE